LILNIALFAGMTTEVTGDKYLKFVAVEAGELKSFLIKVGSAKVAQELQQQISDYIPYDSSKSASRSRSPTAGEQQATEA